MSLTLPATLGNGESIFFLKILLEKKISEYILLMITGIIVSIKLGEFHVYTHSLDL